jgi:hypothetical protein
MDELVAALLCVARQVSCSHTETPSGLWIGSPHWSQSPGYRSPRLGQNDLQCQRGMEEGELHQVTYLLIR